ncbi:uncharacterized protein BX663DRAFT_248016 [Cokeromyces recurvatus]|uniref:uncharacterized protein n=1 Tax=Cokeromyces recurvatus TaxID=90255 RepID=UPI00221EE91B|nr:uncharacterized protein BX663DRAFT_248016 [Cokeromyces recurvatus]KAI7905998.1 hypothetical protein BX663DRAFT_248016 [Cokeromyces recurvatus]
MRRLKFGFFPPHFAGFFLSVVLHIIIVYNLWVPFVLLFLLISFLSFLSCIQSFGFIVLFFFLH